MEQPMTTRRLMYEGDSLIHAAPDAVDEADTGGNSEADRGGSNATVAKRRAQALRAFFPKLSVWLSNRIHFSRMREVESYLAQATDLVDLEHRIAKIERSARWH